MTDYPNPQRDDRRDIAGILARGFDEHMEVHGPDGSYAVRDGTRYEVTERDGASVARVFYRGRYYSVTVSEAAGNADITTQCARCSSIALASSVISGLCTACAADDEKALSSPDVRPYSGSRRCLVCPDRAEYDLGGVPACGKPAHVERVQVALDSRRAQEDAAEEGVAAELRQSDAS